MSESIVSEAPPTIPSRNDMFDGAHLKLGYARAILDALAMLDVAKGTDALKTHTLSTCLLHADELLGEAGQMFMDAHTAQAREAA